MTTTTQTQFNRERNLLFSQAGPTVRKLMAKGAFIAGGAVTSIFSGAKINDFDLYCENRDTLEAVKETIDAKEKLVTDNAVSFTADKQRIQLITMLTGTPQDVIGSFDFSVCQGAYLNTGEFVLGQYFQQHLAQRRLVFNAKSAFPICALYRVKKYTARGYSVSGVELVKMALAIHNLRIASRADFKRQLMGIDTLFLKAFTDSLKSDTPYNYEDDLAAFETWIDNALSNEQDL